MTTVLIVDDSRVSRMMLHGILQDRQPDWTFMEAGDGEAALRCLEAQPADLAVLDVNMPGMDGLTAAEHIVKRYPQTTVVILTANVQQSSRDRAKAIGAHFVGKPITQDAVTQILAILDARHA